MAKQNAINNKSSTLTVDPGASGDSYVQFDINTTGKFRIGVDDDDSDKFKISLGSALGTNDAFVMTSNGECTMPLQTSFGAKSNSAALNVTGDSTTYTLAVSNELWDRNSDFASNTLTAPVTGIYALSSSCWSTGWTTSHEDLTYDIVTTNRTIVGFGFSATSGNGLFDNSAEMHASGIVDMDLGDTATVEFTVGGSTKVINAYGDAGAPLYTNFTGALLC